MSIVPRVRQTQPFGGQPATPGPLPAGLGHNGGPRMHGNGGYMRGETGTTFAGWHATVRDPWDEVRSAYVRAAGRANDIIHNSGWISGAIDQAVANTVGTGLRLRCVPAANAFGCTEEEATEWANLV